VNIDEIASQTPLKGSPSVLAESEVSFRLLADSIPLLCWIADPSGDIFWYNQRWYDFTGTDLESMRAWGWAKIHHPDHLEAVTERWSRALREQNPWEDTFPLLGADGRFGWFLSRAVPIRDENGRVVRWFGTNTDITQERQNALDLERSRARNAAILETALDCIIVIDDQSRILEWNPAAEKTFGHSREFAIRQILPDLIIPASLREAHRRGMTHYLQTGVGPVLGERFETTAVHADGHEFPVELAITRIEDGGPATFSGHLRDISARKKAQAELAFHARLASLSADVGLALNKGDSLREILHACTLAITHHLDAAFARIWTLNELENVLELQASAGLYTHIDGPHSRVPVGQFKIGLIAQERVPHLTNQVIGDPRVADQEWAAREGMVAFAGYPLLVDGRIMGVMAMFARHELSDEILRALSTVADAVALGVKRKRAEADRDRARLAAEEASRAKSLFLANMSHELRTPLNAILGYSEMLEEEAVEQGLSGFTPDLGKINAAGKHLLALINDILDLSKIEAGKMELWVESFDPRALIEDVASATRPLFGKGGNDFRLEIAADLGTMRADETKVRQCLFNLLSNAAKFTQNGQVTLAARRESLASLDLVSLEGKPTRDWLFFEVRDSGIGIRAEQVLRLFQPFTQADASTTRQFGGTGLGLSITRRFCQMMGGDVTVQSTPGVGSTFTLKIPASIDETPQIALAPLPPVDSAPLAETEIRLGTAVLVIDDDATQRDLMERFLAREGFVVQTASGGEEGLRLARQLRPLAITLDVMMPNMDGWSTLTALKADAELRDIPVIMLTMVDDKNRGYALGAADYATKPIDRARLTQILQKYVCPDPPCPVLLVEDDAVTRHMMRALLEREGWAVSEASNGREALLRVEENPPVVILLDLMMPEMDGFEFTANLQQNEKYRAIPIVVLTAKDLTEADRLRLHGSIQKVLHKSGTAQDELWQQVRDLVAECAASQVAPPCLES